jgi:predicted dehydrogenase
LHTGRGSGRLRRRWCFKCPVCGRPDEQSDEHKDQGRKDQPNPTVHSHVESSFQGVGWLARLAIAGCGGVAQAKWLPAIQYLQARSEPVALCGVVDPSRMARDKVASLYDAPAHASIESLLAQDRPDLILVVCSNDAHAPTARAAIAADVPVLVEKPLCRTAAEAHALCAYAESRNVMLASVANKRFSPPYALAHALSQEGRLHTAPTVFSGKFTLGYPYVDLLEDGTVHLLDLALWFMGPVASVHAIGTTGPTGKLESAAATLGFASGAIGAIVTSAAGMSFKPWERVELIGRNAMLAVEDQFELTLFDEETGPAKSWRPAIPNTLMFDESFGGYAGLLENVLDAIRGLVPLNAGGRDGAAALALCEAIRSSVNLGVVIHLDPPVGLQPLRSRDAPS